MVKPTMLGMSETMVAPVAKYFMISKKVKEKERGCSLGLSSTFQGYFFVDSGVSIT
jgi:hypothetical protein